MPRDDRQWFRYPEGSPDIHTKLVPYAMMLFENERARHSKNRARERIYEGYELLNNRAAIVSLESAGIGIARLNASKSIIDTFVSRLAKDRPMPDVEVTDATWEMKRRGREFRMAIVGQMKDTEFDDLSRDALLDGSVFGNGFTRIDSDLDVFAERIPINEMLFDERECRYGKPHQAIRISRIARDYLAELYPEHKEKIALAPASERRHDDDQRDIVLSSLEDYVDVYDGWHPSTHRWGEEPNGLHAVCIHNATLDAELWREPRYPWAMLRLFKPRLGLYGSGFIDQLASLQYRVNCIVRDLQLNLAATGRGHFLVNENNDIPVEMLTGWQPFKLKYKGGQPPTYQAPTPFNQAQLEALIFFIDQMFDLTGVSKANATSKSALGAGASGIALDTQYDIDSDRFRMPQSNYVRYRLDAAQAFVDASARASRRREAHKGKKSSSVSVPWQAKDSVDRLTKIKINDGSYKLQLAAQNFLPDEKAGKLARVEQLAKAGVIPQWLVPALFDEPDLVQVNNILLAPYRNSLKKMDMLVEGKETPMPEQYNDLELELKVATAYYNLVQEEGAPLEVQDRFRQYIDHVTAAIDTKKKAAALGGTMQPGAAPPLGPAEQPLPGGVPPMPTAPVPQPAMIGAPPLLPTG